MRLVCSLAITITLVGRSAYADEVANKIADGATQEVADGAADDAAVELDVSPARRTAATALAVFPGVLVHGLGAYTVRDKPAAKKLILTQAIGLGLAGLGALLVAAPGGSAYTVEPGVPLAVFGGGLLVQSWLTDLWVAAGGSRIAAPPRARAPWSIELGTSYIHDAYRERAFVRAAGSAWLGRLGASAATLVDAGGDAALVDANAYARLLGTPATGALVTDASHLTLRAGTRLHHDGGDRTTQWAQELELTGRLDLARLDAAFRASFVELGTGVGIVHVSYADLASEWSSELLGHFAWGAYLGSRGEAQLFYEHTRDGLVGGLPAARASGFLGYVGASIDVRIAGPWAMRGALAIGNAYLATVALAYRGGPR